jgi:competence protein ComEA
VEYRTEHGGFRSLSDLREVEGIGEKRFATLREALQP